MDSKFGSLRSLSLPFGATSGQRIVLNGDTGEIIIYDSAGREKLLLSPKDQDNEAAFDIFDNAGTRVAKVNELGIIFYDASGNRTSSVARNLITFTDPTTHNIITNIDDTGLTVTDPGGSGKFSQLFAADGSVNAFDYWDFLASRFIGKGEEGYNSTPLSVTLSTTAGTFTDLISVTVPCVSGRKYKVTFQGFDLLSGGSGFATTDQWLLEVLAGATILNGVKWNANVAIAGRYSVPTITGRFVAGSTGNVTFKARGTKSVGAATVTSSVEADANHLISILVENMGS